MIAELFNEGNTLFDLSELLSYRNGVYDPTATLSLIEDANIRVGNVPYNNFLNFLSQHILKDVLFPLQHPVWI